MSASLDIGSELQFKRERARATFPRIRNGKTAARAGAGRFMATHLELSSKGTPKFCCSPSHSVVVRQNVGGGGFSE